MTKITTLLLTTIIGINIGYSAAPVKAEFTVTPKVDFDAGYTTRANHLGLQIQKNSAFALSSVALQNNFVTPKIAATYFFAGEDKGQVALDASLNNKLLGIASASYGVQKRFIDGAADDTFTAYAGLRLDSVPYLSKLATPYVTVSRDFSLNLIGTTVGIDRTFSLGKFAMTPRAEAYLFDKHTSYLAGGSLAYTGLRYVKPYVDLSYVTTDTSLANRKFEGNMTLTTGLKMSF